ncbi:MAG: LysR family transcriptional regulator, partial [Peptococcaceae bacterium]|nr:LysR family transcriptional regulator [Peptococcaceae bacterium]
MHLDQLRYLMKIEETGSITESAECLYVTQQAISKSIQTLEKELGATILIREKYGVSFTAQGREVLAFAKRVVEDEQQLKKTLGKMQQQEQRADKSIRLCSASSVINVVLPKIISKSFLKKRALKANISVADSPEVMMEQLVAGEKDLGLISIGAENLMRVYAKYKDVLKLDILYSDEVVAVMDRKHCEKETVTIHEIDISNRPLTVYNIFSVTTDQVAEYDVTEYDMIYSTDADFHRSMMEHAGAVTYMSKLAYQYFFNRKRYVQLIATELKIPLLHTAVYRKDVDVNVQDLVT